MRRNTLFPEPDSHLSAEDSHYSVRRNTFLGGGLHKHVLTVNDR